MEIDGDAILDGDVIVEIAIDGIEGGNIVCSTQHSFSMNETRCLPQMAAILR